MKWTADNQLFPKVMYRRQMPMLRGLKRGAAIIAACKWPEGLKAGF
ncbi:hypothetical protein C4K01_3311 [Pseudomonas synxantha]|nr:hypothetical protein C4K01_3311 [Pseudomonas synxantha]